MVNYERKTEHIHIVMSPGLKTWLITEAARRDQSISEYLRELLITHSGYRRALVAKALED